MPSRIEEEYARRMLARKLRGGPADPAAIQQIVAPTSPQYSVEVGRPEIGVEIGPPEIVSPPQEELLAGPIETAPASSQGEMMMADAKVGAMSKSQRRRMRRARLEEALREKARSVANSPVFDEMLR